MPDYAEKGYESRGEYLEHLAKEYGVPLNMVLQAASTLGPAEDFDGLVTAIEDLTAEHYDY